MRLEEEKKHLIERISALQAAQLEYERTVEKERRDQEERTAIIVRHFTNLRILWRGSDYCTERTRKQEGMGSPPDTLKLIAVA
jgi:hypothetical protein